METRVRVARAVDDDEYELPTIDRIYHVARKEVKSETDPFKKSGDEVKALNGVHPNLKRRVTTELKKYNRSADGNVESKQLTDEEVFTGYDAFGVVEPVYSLETFNAILQISTPHYAAVQAKASNIVGLGYKFVETNSTTRQLEDLAEKPDKLKRVRRTLDIHRDDLTEALEAFNEENSFTEIMMRVVIDFETTGNGYIEVGRKRDGTIGYLGHIPAHSVRIRRKRDGFVQINGGKAVYFRNFGTDTPNPIGSDNRPNELIHFMNYVPGSDYYGLPDIVAAQQAIAGNEFAAQFNLDYFENKAVPRHVITLKGANLTGDSVSELLEFFETGLKGQNHRSLFIPLPADDGTNKVEFNIDTIESGSPDAAFVNFKKDNRNDILMAHRTPITKVSTGDGTGVAMAKDADKTFKEQVTQPRQGVFEHKVNRIIKELTDAYELKFHEMALTDTNTQSQIDERMVKNGIWVPNEIRARDGMAHLEGGNERVDLNAAAKAKQDQVQATRERDAQRSANQSDSPADSQGRNAKGEGRRIE